MLAAVILIIFDWETKTRYIRYCMFFFEISLMHPWLIGGSGGLDFWDPLVEGLLLRGNPGIPNHPFTIS